MYVQDCERISTIPMASMREGDKKWKRRLALAKAEKMRATKFARLEVLSPLLLSMTLSTTTPSLSETPLLSPPSTEPSPSGMQELQLPTADVDSNDESKSVSDDGESDFDDEKAQNMFNDWVVSLCAYDRKMLAVALLHTFRTRQGMLVMDAAKEAASFTGFNEKTVRTYCKQFTECRGEFEDSKQGKYERYCLLNEERLDAAMWARENAYRKGEPNMTAGKFCKWANNELLPSRVLPANLSRTISMHTANRWLHKLGFTPKSHKKGSYVDGHEREDVVKSREVYLKFISDLKRSHKPTPPCSDEVAAVPAADAEH